MDGAAAWSTVEYYLAGVALVACAAALIRGRRHALCRLEPERYGSDPRASADTDLTRLLVLAVALGPVLLWLWPRVASRHGDLALVIAGAAVLALAGWRARGARRDTAMPAGLTRVLVLPSLLALSSVLISTRLSGAVHVGFQPGSSVVASQPAPNDPPFSFRFQSGVGREERAAVREGIATAQAYFARTYGTNVQQPVIVEVRAVRPASVQYGGITGGHHILLYAGDAEDDPYSDFELEQGAVHELFHVLQGELSASKANYDSPDWLIEGSAEVAADEAMIDAGWASDQEVAACRVWHLRPQAGRVPPLEALSAPGSIDGSRGDYYALATIAADDLARGPGFASLGTYFGLLAHESWQDAFRGAFHTDPQAFYQHITTLRATLRMPTTYPCDYEFDGGLDD